MKTLFFLLITLFGCNKCYNESHSYIKSITLKNKHVDSLVSCRQFNYFKDSTAVTMDSFNTIMAQTKEGLSLSYFNPRNTKKFKYILNYINSYKEYTIILKTDDEDDCGYRYPKTVEIEGRLQTNTSNTIIID